MKIKTPIAIIVSLILAMAVGLSGCITASPPAGVPIEDEAPALQTSLTPPELMSPQNGATGIELTPALLWKEVPNAEGYEVLVSRNYDFSDIVHSVSCRLTAYRVIDDLIPLTQYYWMVAAKLNPADPDTTIAWSPVWAFTTGTAGGQEAATQPTPTSPPPTSTAPASLPISAEVNLAPYSEMANLDYPENSSITKGCVHMSSTASLAEEQTITLTVESDFPINWYDPASKNPKPETCIIFARVETVGITSLGAEQVSFFNEGNAAQIVIKVKESYIHRLMAFNHDPHSSHYLNYTITDGVASPPSGWTLSSAASITRQSPSCYITPDDPKVKAALNDILSGEWRWAYNDFNALREWVSLHVSYKSDQNVHGVRDYWQLPSETLQLGSGDCEDFAILLCSLLRANGVPAEQVYVAVGVSEDNTYHAYLVEKWYKGIWRVIEPEWGTLSGLFLMDWLTSTSFEERYCFNDQDYFTGAPSLQAGVYEFEVDYSLYPLTPGASVTFQRHLNAGGKVTGSVEWLADRAWAKENYQIVWDWSLYIYAPDGSTAFTWNGTDLEHTFSFTSTTSGQYKIEILKRDYLARCARLTIDPSEWQ